MGPLVVPRMKLGSQGLEASAQGLGCIPSMARPPRPSPIWWRSDFNVPHTNEVLLGKALQDGVREKAQLATKFGISSGGCWEVHGGPAYERAACEGLGVDCIDLYYNRIHTTVPIEVTMGELKKLVEEGKIKYIVLSEPFGIDNAVHPISAVQLVVNMV